MGQKADVRCAPQQSMIWANNGLPAPQQHSPYAKPEKLIYYTSVLPRQEGRISISTPM
jgi:hypothetical protein